VATKTENIKESPSAGNKLSPAPTKLRGDMKAAEQVMPATSVKMLREAGIRLADQQNEPKLMSAPKKPKMKRDKPAMSGSGSLRARKFANGNITTKKPVRNATMRFMLCLTPTTGVGKRAAFDNPFACNC